MINIKYNKKDNIIYTKWIDKVGVEDLISCVFQIDEKFNKADKLFIIEDAREAEQAFNIRPDLKAVIEEVKLRIDRYEMVYMAHVIGKPAEAVVGFLYQQLTMEITNYKYEIFSSLEAARHWLKNPDLNLIR